MNEPVAMRRQNAPIQYPKTRRPDNVTLMTSAKAGTTNPAWFIPMLPEDQLNTTQVGIHIQMEETAKVLANAVHARAHAYFVSYAALERFGGSMDRVAEAWAGKVGAPALIEMEAYVPGASDIFYKTLGLHHQAAEPLNMLYVQAYNAVVNYRRQQVSISLPKRQEDDHSLARALWGQTAIARIVPTFDAALEQGSVPLVGAQTLVQHDGTSAGGNNFVNVIDGNGTEVGIANTTGGVYVSDTAQPGSQPLYVDLANGGTSITLSSLETAKRTQAFARMREKFANNDDDMIDMLMRGFRIPSAMFQNPILLGSGRAQFGIEQRYATDAANLDTYVTNGTATIRFPIRMPQQPTGGVVVVTYEIVPEPVFDRMQDMFLVTANASEYPNALRDTLDPQKVDIVPNRFIDALHNAPLGTFGYAPMNYAWARNYTRVGGRFHRPVGADPSDEDQQNIWGVTKVDPVLDEDAFLMPADFAHNVFLDTTADPFKVVLHGQAVIEGITQFGPALYEAAGDYDAVASEVDQTFIDPSNNP